MYNTLLINLFAGPGCGKSTLAAWMFSRLKLLGQSAELVTEYAKDRVWLGDTNTLGNQFYVTAKQYHRIWALMGKVEYIITDSPFILGLVYGEYLPSFKAFLLDLFKSLPTYNIRMKRVKPYVAEGRLQTAEEALKKDTEVMNLLVDNHINYGIFTGYGDIEQHEKLLTNIIHHQNIRNLEARSGC